MLIINTGLFFIYQGKKNQSVKKDRLQTLAIILGFLGTVLFNFQNSAWGYVASILVFMLLILSFLVNKRDKPLDRKDIVQILGLSLCLLATVLVIFVSTWIVMTLSLMGIGTIVGGKIYRM